LLKLNDWRFLSASFLLILCSISLPLKADLRTASIKYHSGDFQQALGEFNQLASLGNKDAIYNIAVMYLHGQGVSKDLPTAYAWFTLAAEYGLDEARSAAKLIEQQVKDIDSLAKAVAQLKLEFDSKHYKNTLLPQFNLKPFVLPKPSYHVDAPYPQAAKEQGLEGWVWLEFDVDDKGAVTDVDIIDAYPDKTFNRSIYNALRRWRYSAEDKSSQPPSAWQLVHHFTTFKGKRYEASFSLQKRQYQQQINQLIERAEQGSALVQYHIANWMMGNEHNATGLLKFHWAQPDAGQQLLLESAVNGFANAQYRLGVNLLNGNNVQAQRSKALNWIGYAAAQGFKYAQYRLALELMDEQPDVAMDWLIKAAQHGHFRAMRDLIARLINQQKFQQAQLWLTKALEVDDEHPQLWSSQSQLYQALGQPQASVEAMNIAKEHATDRGWYLN